MPFILFPLIVLPLLHAHHLSSPSPLSSVITYSTHLLSSPQNTERHGPVCSSSYQVSTSLSFRRKHFVVMSGAGYQIELLHPSAYRPFPHPIVDDPRVQPLRTVAYTHISTHSSTQRTECHYHACGRSGGTFPSFLTPACWSLPGAWWGAEARLAVRMLLSRCFPSSCALLSLQPPLNESLYF